ncbi:MAG: hypothetical protein MI746_09395 [Pseudomonadales bacterium]|nr:hypothetical protein [Pseudomonadales bacterium]
MRNLRLGLLGLGALLVCALLTLRVTGLEPEYMDYTTEAYNQRGRMTFPGLWLTGAFAIALYGDLGTCCMAEVAVCLPILTTHWSEDSWAYAVIACLENKASDLQEMAISSSTS